MVCISMARHIRDAIAWRDMTDTNFDSSGILGTHTQRPRGRFLYYGPGIGDLTQGEYQRSNAESILIKCSLDRSYYRP